MSRRIAPVVRFAYHADLTELVALGVPETVLAESLALSCGGLSAILGGARASHDTLTRLAAVSPTLRARYGKKKK